MILQENMFQVETENDESGGSTVRGDHTFEADQLGTSVDHGETGGRANLSDANRSILSETADS